MLFWIIILLFKILTFKYSLVCDILSHLTILNINIFIWLVAFVLVITVSYFIHCLAYYITVNHIEEVEKNSIRSRISTLKDIPKGKVISTVITKFKMIFILSPDYLFAFYFKGVLKKTFNKCPTRISSNKQHLYNNSIVCICHGCEEHIRKKSRKLFVLLSNWLNVILVCLLVIITVLFGQFLAIGLFSKCFFAFLLLRTLSRGLEIVYAFYKDVVESRMTPTLKFGQKLSNLKRGNRISLAVHSYLEMTLIYGIIYFMEAQIDQINSNSFHNLLDSMLYSFSVTALNYSFGNSFTILGKMLHVTQIFIGITLVVLSIANYLGMKDKMSKYEKSDWEKNKYI